MTDAAAERAPRELAPTGGAQIPARRRPRKPPAGPSAPTPEAPFSVADLDKIGKAEVAKHLSESRRRKSPAPADTAAPNMPAPGPTLIRADRVTLAAVSWLWGGYLARGKLHVLAGAPGTGKTTAALSMAATITSGGIWPDGTRAAPADVMIWSGEDDVSDTLTPRLVAAGADLTRAVFIAGFTDEHGARSFDPARDMSSLAEAVRSMERPPALLIIDPVVSAVAGDSHRNAEVRRALQPLVDFAAARRCAVLGISHFSKGSNGKDPTERVSGSLAFGALPRVVMIAAKLPAHEGGGRIFARSKSNIGSDTNGFRFDVEQVELQDCEPSLWSVRVRWGEALSGTASELLGMAEADEEAQNDRQEAAEWLREILADGPKPIPEVRRQAVSNGFSERTLKRAAKDLEVTMTRGGFGKSGTWAL